MPLPHYRLTLWPPYTAQCRKKGNKLCLVLFYPYYNVLSTNRIFDKDKHIFSILILFPPIPYRLTYTLQHLIHPRTVHKDAPGQSEARPDISTVEVSKVSINNESFLYFGRCESATPLRQVYTSQINLISILTHARIEVIHNYIPYEGIQYLVDREVGKIKRYFEQSLTNDTSLSSKEQRTVNAFLKRYGIKCRKIKSNTLKVGWYRVQ